MPDSRTLYPTPATLDEATGGGFLPPGTIVAGRYRIERLLGQGGMGSVYQATHLELDHPVALKTVLPFSASGAAARDRFREEARIAVSLDHPNLVRVLDYGTGDIDFLVMELIDGSNTQRLLREGGPLPPEAVLRIGRDVLAGLACLHERGIVHRDIKPANILIRRQDTRVKLADFGLAADRRKVQDVSGTPAYMPPEVLAGGPATPAGDLFSLGVTLFELLTGERPWAGTTLQELLANMSVLPARPLGGFSVPPALGNLLAGCLRVEADKRLRDASAAQSALQGVPAASPATGPVVPLFRNRLAVVAADPVLGEVLRASLGASGLLDVMLSCTTPADPRLTGLLGQLDAVLLDPTSAPPGEVEAFIGDVRGTHPGVVFFLLWPRSRENDILARFSPAWQNRLDHYFALDLDGPVGELPEMIRTVAKGILFDRSPGGRSQPA